VGDEIEVKVISLDRDRMRIGLSLKQLQSNPWDTLEERYTVNQYIDVVVTNLAKFGAFARLEEGIEGLIHISELADRNIQHPSEVVEPGHSLTVQILSLEPERKRVGLSLRRVPDHLRTPVQPDAGEEAELTAEETSVSQAPPAAEPAAEPVVADTSDDADPLTGDTTAPERDPEDAALELAAESDEPAAAETPNAAPNMNGDKLAEEDGEVVSVSETHE
jgi:small subunit ribosomal protein S1